MDPGNRPFVEVAPPFGEGVAIRFSASADPADLAAAEPFLALPEVLAGAAPERRLSYLAGRLCAGRALRVAGAKELVVGIGADRGPLWPQGWLGSITHTRGGFAAASVASASECSVLGLDSEEWIDQETFADVRAETATLAEVERVSRALGLPPERALTIVFCAKEALYKALAPRVQRFFGFMEAEVVACSAGGVRLRLLADLRDPARAETRDYVPGFEIDCRVQGDAERAHAFIVHRPSTNTKSL